jgi:hypothetical protein
LNARAAPKPEALDTLVRRCVEDPIFFAEEVLNLKPLPTDGPDENWALDGWQRELLQAAADVWRKRQQLPTLVNHRGCNYITARSMHGPGKTFGSAALMHWFNFCFPGQEFITAPKHKQIVTRTWGEFRKILGRAARWYQTLIDVRDSRITWFGDKDWAAFAESAVRPENLAGKHWPYQLVIVEEASGVPEALYPVIFGALSTGPMQILLMISNPTRNNGTFADSHLSEREAHLYHRIHIDLGATTRVSPQWVENLRRKYGENSPIFRVRCLGEFAADDAHQLIASSWVAAAWDREWQEDGSVPRLRVSVDVADGGEDESVVTVGRHFQSHVRLLKQQAFSFPSDKATVDCADAAERMFLAAGGRKDEDDFVVDAVGVGTGVAGVLFERGYRVVRYKGGSESDNPKSWRNRRVQSYMVLRDAFRDGRLSFADDFMDDSTELQAQLCSVRSKPGTERLEDLLTKEEMRAAGITSPDRADSMAMQYATQAPRAARLPEGAAPRMAVVESTLLEGLVA